MLMNPLLFDASTRWLFAGTLGVLVEAGLGAFGDMEFRLDSLAQIGAGTELGRLWAQGTARAGEHYGVQRVPVIKKQAISAYDPRVVEVTGINPEGARVLVLWRNVNETDNAALDDWFKKQAFI